MFNADIQCQIPILSVIDFQQSLHYYTEVLGFEVAWIWDEDGYGAVRCGEIEIHLDKQEYIEVSSSYLFVKNSDVVYSYYKQQGVEIIKEIESKPWGVREFTFRDINGHKFRVAHIEEENHT
ncbi:VOC family protein [Paenibacillus sp. RC67]|uniref:VOC family protein n=1 Tax=Paenibacillus sp. RC67 TaxID=3039392 RepID=UPI0024AE26AE|nr:VOC family protein [Paenibacillus sp. RC67]